LTDLVKVRGDWHPEVLYNGLTMPPGEPFERSTLTAEDQRLIDEGIIIDATVTPAALEGDALQQRAKELGVKGRAGMSADDLRQAVALEETRQATSVGVTDEPQRIGG
jgi:hypothetical protein